MEKSARNKMMDLLARREHSEMELRKKLGGSHFDPEEIEQAIKFAKKSRWLPDSEIAQLELSQKTAADLRRKGKGILYINQYLEERGLPVVKADSTEELEKAQALVENKFSKLGNLDPKIRDKVGRFLISRGFDMDVVRKVIYEKC